MNVHTFKDVGKRSSLANEIDDDDEDVEEKVVPLERAVEGEEEDGNDKVSKSSYHVVV